MPKVSYPVKRRVADCDYYVMKFKPAPTERGQAVTDLLVRCGWLSCSEYSFAAADQLSGYGVDRKAHIALRDMRVAAEFGAEIKVLVPVEGIANLRRCIEQRRLGRLRFNGQPKEGAVGDRVFAGDEAPVHAWR